MARSLIWLSVLENSRAVFRLSFGDAGGLLGQRDL
jgi:hypothetical protein